MEHLSALDRPRLGAVVEIDESRRAVLEFRRHATRPEIGWRSDVMKRVKNALDQWHFSLPLDGNAPAPSWHPGLGPCAICTLLLGARRALWCVKWHRIAL